MLLTYYPEGFEGRPKSNTSKPPELYFLFDLIRTEW